MTAEGIKPTPAKRTAKGWEKGSAHFLSPPSSQVPLTARCSLVNEYWLDFFQRIRPKQNGESTSQIDDVLLSKTHQEKKLFTISLYNILVVEISKKFRKLNPV